MRVFHTRDIWWTFTTDCVKANLLRFPGIFSVFLLISTSCSLNGLHLPQIFNHLSNSLEAVPSALTAIDLNVIHVFQFCFFVFYLVSAKHLSIFSLFFIYFHSIVLEQENNLSFSPFFISIFFCGLELGHVFWPGLCDPFVPLNPGEFYASHFLGRMLVRGFTISL